MEFYDDYEKNGNINELIEFTKKTLPSDGTDKLFIGCVLILFSKADWSKPRYYCTRENLEEIVLLAKEKEGNTNLLSFYVDRVNQAKKVTHYLKDVVNDPNLDKYADLIIEYLDQFKLNIASEVRKHKSLEKFINTVDNREYIGKELSIKIDRPFGSKHPKHGFIYPVNYGYVPNTVSGDGEELDAYLLGFFEPVEEFTGKCIAIIHRTNDDDDKLVVVPNGKEYSDAAIEALVEFQERFFEHVLIRD